MSSDTDESKTQRVLEIEIARDGDHSTHEDTVTVFVIGSEDAVAPAATKAGQLVDEKFPAWMPEDTTDVTALKCGSRSLDSAEWRQFIDESRDDVIVGPEVPV